MITYICKIPSDLEFSGDETPSLIVIGSFISMYLVFVCKILSDMEFSRDETEVQEYDRFWGFEVGRVLNFHFNI